MYIRWSGWFIIPCWISAMGWLFVRDVLPAWTAGKPPTPRLADWFRENDAQVSFAITDDAGRKLGTVWTRYHPGEYSFSREDYVFLDDLPIPIGPVGIDIDSIFTAAGALDEFTVSIDSPHAQTKLHGERFHAAFSFELEGWLGDRRMNETFKLPLAAGDDYSAALHSLAPLTNLAVGQSWRMQVLNPVAALLGMGDRFSSIVVTVVGEENLMTAEGVWPCFVLQSMRMKAWVDADGRVRRQEIELPVLGRVHLTRQATFDERELEQRHQNPLFNRRVWRR